MLTFDLASVFTSAATSAPTSALHVHVLCAYTQAMLEHIGDIGIGDLVHRHTDHKAWATCTLGVVDLDNSASGDGEEVVQTFVGEVRGSIVPAPIGGIKHGTA
jgi:hypothetical protein